MVASLHARWEATVESATELDHAHDLVSVFVDLDSLERVAGLIE